jgi:molybdopterin synthase sulfur carrier subunit
MTDASAQRTAVLVRIPTPLRRLTGGQGEVTVDGRSVQELLDALERRFPGMRERLYDETGQLRRFVNIYINDEDIRFAQGVDTPVKAGDEVSIVPAIAGGAPPAGPASTSSRRTHGQL